MNYKKLSLIIIILCSFQQTYGITFTFREAIPAGYKAFLAQSIDQAIALAGSEEAVIAETTENSKYEELAKHLFIVSKSAKARRSRNKRAQLTVRSLYLLADAGKITVEDTAFFNTLLSIVGTFPPKQAASLAQKEHLRIAYLTFTSKMSVKTVEQEKIANLVTKRRLSAEKDAVALALRRKKLHEQQEWERKLEDDLVQAEETRIKEITFLKKMELQALKDIARKGMSQEAQARADELDAQIKMVEEMFDRR